MNRIINILKSKIPPELLNKRILISFISILVISIFAIAEPGSALYFQIEDIEFIIIILIANIFFQLLMLKLFFKTTLTISGISGIVFAHIILYGMAYWLS